ncbi:mitochondrial ribosomal protein subunit L23 [Phaeosphaeria sp. MPI-PUGE-AT-0046c]|nr:mitochondrial ribosomal protein subunit L23 [Phaeosphaeria sp. MPI-PUGE-AT-0046c]
MDAIPITKKLIAFGTKKIYLPKFTIALVRTAHLSPYHARFLVPLDFSKYDLRDYLYHAYNVKCFNVRSFVKQMPVRDTQEQPRHWFREESKKYMTVEMEQPFVWPKTPSLEPWGKEERKQEMKDSVANNSQPHKREQRTSARNLQDEVKKLLKIRGLSSGKKAEQENIADRDNVDEAKEEGVAGETKSERQQRLTRLRLWESQRTPKVVESDDRGNYTIKA